MASNVRRVGKGLAGEGLSRALDEIATRLEKAKDVNAEILNILKDTVKNHEKIIFNGNNYSPDWEKEAAQRGLPNVKTTIDALKSFITPKAIKLFGKYNVLSKDELHSRYDIYTEQFSKQINIEALTAMQMVRRLFFPAAIRYMAELGNSIAVAGKSAQVQKELLDSIGSLLASANKKLKKLETETAKAQAIDKVDKQAIAFRDKVRTGLVDLRADIDAIEELTPSDLWPVPVYSEMLFKL